MIANEEIPAMNTYTKEHKLEHLRLFRASGKNCNEYCREKGIPRSTMHAWVHASDGQGIETRPAMVKLPRRLPMSKAIAADITAKPTPTITLSIGPWSATITGGAGRSDIETIVSVLGGACHAN
jgi:transposase-like protein